MQPASKLRRWAFVHKWTSVICTAFLLVICLTGLPLTFSEEIDRWLEPHSYAELPEGTPSADLDRIVALGRQMHPGEIVSSIFVDDDEPQIYLWMAPSFDMLKADPKSGHFIRFDARTAEVLEESKPMEQRRQTFMNLMLRLHVDLFAGLPGELFMALMAALFVAAIVSGVALYAPFMHRLEFGAVRVRRAPRVRWLDMHNLLGATTLAWALVIGVTGVMNELSTPLFTLWRKTDVEAMLAPWRDRATPAQSELGSVQRALDATRAALPGMIVTNVAFPGSELGSPHHYLLWAKGRTPLTSRLFSPALADARTGELTAVAPMPWYLRALELSRPLHFGDYGGAPLKAVWAALDLVTIIVLGSGLYLWLGRGRRRAASETAGVQAASETPFRQAAE